MLAFSLRGTGHDVRSARRYEDVPEPDVPVKGRDEKKEGITRNHKFPHMKEGRDSLPGSTVETPQTGGYRPGGFLTRSS
jgi:hypothetical protein